MTRRVEVGTHVVRGHDVLSVHAVLRLALDVLHLERRVVGPEGAALVQGLGQVIELHRGEASVEKECGVRSAECGMAMGTSITCSTSHCNSALRTPHSA